MSASLETPTAPDSSLPTSAATAAHAAVASAVSTSNAEDSTTDVPAAATDGDAKDEALAEAGPKADPTVFADASNFSLKHPLYSKVGGPRAREVWWARPGRRGRGS